MALWELCIISKVHFSVGQPLTKALAVFKQLSIQPQDADFQYGIETSLSILAMQDYKCCIRQTHSKPTMLTFCLKKKTKKKNLVTTIELIKKEKRSTLWTEQSCCILDLKSSKFKINARTCVPVFGQLIRIFIT